MERKMEMKSCSKHYTTFYKLEFYSLTYSHSHPAVACTLAYFEVIGVKGYTHVQNPHILYIAIGN